MSGRCGDHARCHQPRPGRRRGELHRLTTRRPQRGAFAVRLTDDGAAAEQVVQGGIPVRLGPKRTRSALLRQGCQSRRSNFTGYEVRLPGPRGERPAITATFNVDVDACASEGFPDAIVKAVACAVPGDATALAGRLLRLLAPPPEESAVPGRTTRRRMTEHYGTGDVFSRSATGSSTIARGLG
jgi:hypothetical protein